MKPLIPPDVLKITPEKFMQDELEAIIAKQNLKLYVSINDEETPSEELLKERCKQHFLYLYIRQLHIYSDEWMVELYTKKDDPICGECLERQSKHALSCPNRE